MRRFGLSVAYSWSDKRSGRLSSARKLSSINHHNRLFLMSRFYHEWIADAETKFQSYLFN
jgi:hypothetical protein